MLDIAASPRKTLVAGAALTLLLLLVFAGFSGTGGTVFIIALRWLHVTAASVWVGLIWFVNFIQLPALAAADDNGRAVLMRQIVPAVAWWLRHLAAATVAAGLLLAFSQGILADALLLGSLTGFAVKRTILLGIGMWLGVLMWGIVWFILGPEIKKLTAGASISPEQTQRARQRVRNFARINLLLSLPVIFAMTAARYV